MAVRFQVYEWANLAPPGQVVSLIGRQAGDVPVAVPANRQIDIFAGGLGVNQTVVASTNEVQFVVIEEFGCSPYLNSFIQIRVGTTDYFENPDGEVNYGVSGRAMPYPRGGSTQYGTPGVPDPQGIRVLKSFNLDPHVYIPPGLTYQVLYTSRDGTSGTPEVVLAFIKYMLYDGADSLIALRLLKMGLGVTVENVDWYKRLLLESELSLRQRVSPVDPEDAPEKV
ncbi:MAG: hypothetical protein CL398_00140 [Acidiferrobacteraceae bacterium]|nr:hypothetical protein [Acidiferrobacteraceae bacterium]